MKRIKIYTKKESLVKAPRIVIMVIGFLLSCFAQPIMAQKKAAAESIVVEGVVVDENNRPMKAVQVGVQEKNIDALTDNDGKFYMLTQPNDVLVVDIDGYKPSMTRLSGKSSYTIKLVPYLKKEQDVVTVGYGTQSQRQLTSAVSTISSDDIGYRAVTSIEEAMNGSLSGLYSLKSGGSQLGLSNYNFLIRGKATNAGTRPLFIIDDMEANIEMIDPNEIESISILKDASALAIYGMRGASGVVLVKTKRGSSTRHRINVDIKAGFQTPEYKSKRLNAYQYSSLYNEALINDGDNPRFNPEAYLNNPDPYAYPDVNYMDEFTKNNGLFENYTFTASGGNQIARYFVSAGYMHQEGIFKNCNNNPDYERYNFRSNIDVNITRDLTLNVLMSAAIGKAKSPFINTDTDVNSSIDNVYNNLMTMPANAMPLFNEDKTLGGTSEYQTNMYGLLNRRGRRTDDTRLLTAKASAKYDFNRFVEGLSVDLFYGFENFNRQYVSVNQSYAVFDKQADGTYTQFGTDDIKNTRNSDLMGGYYRYMTLGAGVSYNKQLNEANRLDLRLLYNHSIETIPNDNPDSKYQALLLRAQYGLLNRYFVEVTGALQGSTYYPSGKRNGLFPAVGLGWIVSDESWLRDVTAINYLKLRGSIGLVGNDQTGGKRFPHRQVFTSNGGYQFGSPNGYFDGSTEEALSNPDETWEKSLKANIGFDVELFKGLSLTADYFYDRRTEILVPYSNLVPGIIGNGLAKYNGGEVHNQGVDATVMYRKTFHKGSFFVGGNMMFARNKVIDLKEIAYQYSYQYRKGYPIDARFGYQTQGFYLNQKDLASAPIASFGIPEMGDLRYVNQNAQDDHMIDDRDMVYIGNGLPEFIGGFSLGVDVRGFDARVAFEGSAVYETYYKPSTFTTYVYDNRWNSAEPSLQTLYPRVSHKSSYNNQTSDFWQEKGGLFRMSAAEIGYTLPVKWTKKVFLNKVRFYANANNPFSFITMKDGRNPEAGNAGYSEYPIMRSFTFGVSIGL